MLFYFRIFLILAFLVLSVFIISYPIFRALRMVRIGARKDGFLCERCGRCCRWFNIHLNKNDVKRIESHGFQREYFLEKDGHLKKPDGSCIFLKNDKGGFSCSIQSFKPSVCRIWPFRTKKIFGKSITYVNTRFDCPSLKKLFRF